MKLNFFRKPSFIGLDINPEGIWLVELNKIKAGFLIERTEMSKLPNDMFAEGKIHRWDAFYSILSAFVDGLKIKGMAVATHLPAQLVRVQCVQLPRGLTETEIEKEIIALVHHDIPGMNDVLCVDFNILSKKITGYEDVHFTVARQDYLDRYVSCLETVGLLVKIVDVDIYALKRAICLTLPNTFHNFLIIHQTKTTAIVILGNTERILFYQHWQIHEASEIWSQFKNRIQICLAGFQALQLHYLVCTSPKNAEDAETLAASFGLQVRYTDLISHFKFNAQLDVDLLTANATDFMIAYGLAMRDVPKC